MTTNLIENDSQHTIDDTIIVIITLISILITTLVSCFTPSPKKSLPPLGTNLLPKKKVSSSTKPRPTSKTLPKVPSHVPVTSSVTSEESLGATGFQPVATTPPKRRTRSRAGTTSQPTKTLKNGPSTQSASRPVTTKSNPTIPTVGSPSLA